ncbi:hypothetical protein QWY75_03735 [Pontixanthobacter aestiaquae]|uniref:Uncharacterized protein n=1 Tax=Pontixanthobacter aestiaquae TaxID=1509367 RepID=A0A844Z4T1_9SPHN|nr:hypothetical protein [Pontixanthobacter aestiaquae]MDN3645318.1 hypothetical protein [Pontixanthobacter aestiaquae]MXO83681.1 hypothetical protein [Pontixanthobacter aestiaquae]
MIQLPALLRRLPYIFYGIAVLLFIWNVANQWMNITSMMGYSDPTLGNVVAYQKSIALYSAFSDAAYMVSNGAIIQVLIAIFDKLQGAAE